MKRLKTYKLFERNEYDSLSKVDKDIFSKLYFNNYIINDIICNELFKVYKGDYPDSWIEDDIPAKELYIYNNYETTEEDDEGEIITQQEEEIISSYNMEDLYEIVLDNKDIIKKLKENYKKSNNVEFLKFLSLLGYRDDDVDTFVLGDELGII